MGVNPLGAAREMADGRICDQNNGVGPQSRPESLWLFSPALIWQRTYCTPYAVCCSVNTLSCSRIGVLVAAKKAAAMLVLFTCTREDFAPTSGSRSLRRTLPGVECSMPTFCTAVVRGLQANKFGKNANISYLCRVRMHSGQSLRSKVTRIQRNHD